MFITINTVPYVKSTTDTEAKRCMGVHLNFSYNTDRIELPIAAVIVYIDPISFPSMGLPAL